MINNENHTRSGWDRLGVNSFDPSEEKLKCNSEDCQNDLECDRPSTVEDQIG